MTGIRIVDDVAVVAEELDHHPDVDIRWRKVTFTLSTHSQGGVTGRDVELARRIDEIAQRHGAH
jgi:4a-hydroxytetrahydrobiopterin dehydratase